MADHLLCAALLVAFGSSVSAQSPPAVASVTIDRKVISIRYSAPSVRGRRGNIFGNDGLVSRDPTYPAWSAGANAATSFHTDADMDLGSLTVPKGDYTLYVWVQDPDAWALIVNKQTGQQGREYTAAQDLGRVTMTMTKPPAPIERLKYVLTDEGNGKGELRLEWEDHIATVPMTVK